MPRHTTRLIPWFLATWFLVPIQSHAAIDASQTLVLQTGGTERVRITSQGISLTGIVTATSFAGDGSRLTNLPPAQAPACTLLSTMVSKPNSEPACPSGYVRSGMRTSGGSTTTYYVYCLKLSC